MTQQPDQASDQAPEVDRVEWPPAPGTDAYKQQYGEPSTDESTGEADSTATPNPVQPVTYTDQSSAPAGNAAAAAPASAAQPPSQPAQ